jgi:hypothetical protein
VALVLPKLQEHFQQQNIHTGFLPFPETNLLTSLHRLGTEFQHPDKLDCTDQALATKCSHGYVFAQLLCRIDGRN